MSCGEPHWWHKAILEKKEPMETIEPIPYSLNKETEEMMKMFDNIQDEITNATAVPQEFLVTNEALPLKNIDDVCIRAYEPPKVSINFHEDGVTWENTETKETMDLVKEIRQLKAEIAELKKAEEVIPAGTIRFNTMGTNLEVFDGEEWQQYDLSTPFDISSASRVVPEFNFNMVSLVKDDTYPIGMTHEEQSDDLKQNPLDDFDRAMKGVI